MFKKLNLTKDPIWYLLRKVTIPASVGSLFQTFYNLVDTWFAGRISAEAIGAIAKSFPIYFVIIAVGVGIGAATNASIGNLLGANGIGSDSVQLKLVELDNPNNNMLVNINFSAQYGLALDNQNLDANSIKILSCYPNPFNSSILFKYKLGISNEVELAICNVLGEEVQLLVDEVQKAGNYYVKWDGNNGFNQSLPSGIYFLRMKSGDDYMMKKITLMK